MIDLFNYEIIILDLDDTIYPEINYLKKAYKFISEKIIFIENNPRLILSEINSYIVEEFNASGRLNIYQKIKNKFKLTLFTLENFQECLRTVPIEENELKINTVIHDIILNLIKRNKKIFILTNGNVKQQKNKVQALDIPFKNKIKVIYATGLGEKYQKPNPYFLNEILTETQTKLESALFIGDSDIDKKTAENAGMTFMFCKNL